ncbi:flavin reductase family protein [Amycolatopsis jejuensis]|uniref:flavin reductase family protein n=1 Tax=Amycolatopsis jejuensis TaxID=330084 RepID=UPI000524C291|nr:flavin reductase family protein [Amycolatopsis jejuensis]
MTTSDRVRAAFTEVMATVPTSVTVVTTMDHTGPHGTTVSAFTSLSLSPPMVLVSLDRRSQLLARVQETGQFGVNVLADAQSCLATTFARKGAGKFDGVSWHPSDGLPRLAATAGWLACRLTGLVDGGDHLIALGTVTAAETGAHAPMTYQNRRFGVHLAADPAAP